MSATSHVLVVNAGSSSLKYQLIDPDTGESVAAGMVERIGLETGTSRHTVGGETFRREVTSADHGAAIHVLQDAFLEHGPYLRDLHLVAVGHRVVHGGERFSAPVVVDDDVVEAVRELVPLAPLHNPANLAGIEVAREAFPDLPQVAVFDTAFHATIPPAASTYAVPSAWRERYGVRKYGFHGTSHAYVSRRVAGLLGRPLEEVRTIVLHLGNGASACAVDGGRSVDTSMGLSPLDGLVMGTRPGDLDPSLPAHLGRVAGLSAQDYDEALSRGSGLKGLTGSSDFREVMEMRAAGDKAAVLAFDVVIHRIVRHVGALAAVLGRVDAVAFTAGVGEHDPVVRAAVADRLGLLGVDLDREANDGAHGETCISTPDSDTSLWVVPTNEEGEIARQSAELLR
ncbi:acetate/propionate family kinase [Ornithinimicrobium sediminis]|uniref:acetate/propionate family kinase n=1 Tax=Ornithinimicrobium sediminis TaxID=2904603 RepID=UPI001E579148|nr:acetate kinase [Ornithinimicrobium sediminis]MCE0487793.1 acetate kinase [Ornithinimicrobium sediminis]